MWDDTTILRKCLMSNKIEMIKNVKDGDFTKLYYIKRHNINCYLKNCREPLCKEGSIYRILAKEFSDVIPQIYSINNEKGYCSILMEDLGNVTLKSYGPSMEYILQSIMKIIILQERYRNNYRIFEKQEVNLRYNSSLKSYFLSSIEQSDYIKNSIKDKLINLIIRIQIDNYPLTIVHGDFYCDNIILHNDRIKIIDWGFAHIGIGSFDIATLFTKHKKNGDFEIPFEQCVIIFNEAYYRLYGKKLQQDYLKKYLALGFALEYTFLILWIEYRIRIGLWKTDTQEQVISNYCNQLLKYLSYLK